MTAYMQSLNMKKIVIDTSVLISAIIVINGPSRQVFRLCLQNQLSPVISQALFAEYEAVSHRAQIMKQSPLSGIELRRFLNAFYASSDFVKVFYLWRPNLRDESDNFLVELAIAANASYIITNNTKDFNNASLCFDDIQVITPEHFLRNIACQH